jgi:quercetin dioxygenase-like cupin family protein
MAAVFDQPSDDGFREVLPGIRLKTRVFGRNSLLAEFRLEAGSVLPRHAHPHEQTGYLARGRIRLTIGGESRDVRAGGAWSIPGDTEHGAVAIEDSVAVEIFSPVREDYLPTAAE